MDQFPHLKFVQKITGKPRLFGGGGVHDRTQNNKSNRPGHSQYLISQTDKIREEWEEAVSAREADGLAPLSKDVIPFFLQINPDLINAGFELETLGIEIVSEEVDGFIIGASLDSLRTLEEKIKGFLTEKYGTALIGDLWQIIDGNRESWKVPLILSEELLDKWQDIQDNELYSLEVSIAFDKPIGKEPDPTKQGGVRRLERYRRLEIERDNKLLERQEHFARFINTYGEIVSSLISMEDSFACEVKISGKGLKDLVVNYPFVFEVAEKEEFETVTGNAFDGSIQEVDILVPQDGSPEIAVVDSGIMENHRYLSASIKPAHSKSYIDGDPSTADNVQGGGHGTKVAGAILYPKGITAVALPYQLPFFIRNLRILDGDNFLTTNLPAELMKAVIADNPDCAVFNLSVCSVIPFRQKHMSTWAAMIDMLMHEKNILFIVSAGNLRKDDIRYFINQGDGYPSYLERPFARLANPGQSSFALTVGSVNHASFSDSDWGSIGVENEVSPFSRIGWGIWGQIKPDVVEFGGGLVMSKDRRNLVRENQSVSPELIRSTLHGGPAYGKDSVGTSFSTPKVTHIVGQLKKLYPDENCNLLRALVVQGARLPGPFFQNPTIRSLRHFGYGLPSLERVTTNSDQRTSYYNTGKISAEEAHIYLLKLPDILLNPGDEFDVLIEVTLAYTGKVRRTRQKTKSYLSTWLDWTTSKKEEPFNDFRDFVLKEIEGTATTYDKEKREQMDDFRWRIGNRTNNGVQDMTRNNNTVQKDWTIVRPYELSKELSFAIRGHRGWDKDQEEVPYALTVSIEVLNVNVPIYEAIRIENEVEIPV